VPAIHDPLTASFRLFVFVVWTLAMGVVQALLLAAGSVAWSRRNGRWYWRGVAYIVGLRLVVRGEPSARDPVLYVANHGSYLDIIALGALLKAAFIAKSEVRGWPGIGLIARLGRTVFVDRHPRKSVAQRDEMLARLSRAGESLILFAEGTSNDGNRILPFKSALFSTAEVTDAGGKQISVQPVTVAYTQLDGIPIGRAWRPLFAWYGDMELVSHLWVMAGLGITTVEIVLHPPVCLDQFVSRKALADHCHDVIGRGLAAALAGRLPDPAPALGKPA
jgi:1-acyl-sn-glycerol-3-phosphate acyltransferase